MTAAAPTHPLLELFGRYGAVLRAAWSARSELAGPTRLSDEAAFLPAALSLQETPAHPSPRRLAWAVCVLFAVAVIWAWFGKVDIVAVAPGRIVVSEKTKTLQPLEAGVVKRLLVKDGDAVRAGQLLVELDATNARADGTSVQEQLDAAFSEELRTAALLKALKGHGRAHLELPVDAEIGEGWLAGGPLRDEAALRLAAEWQDTTAKVDKLNAEELRRQAEMVTAREMLAKLQATVPLAQQREADFRRLAEQGFVSAHAGQDRTRERIELERDLATQHARLAEARAALSETFNARSAYLAETRRLLNERHADAGLKRHQLVQELQKTEQRSRLTRLTSPVDGTVQQVAVHTEGGVVTPAQVLMIIVPASGEVTAEVELDNKDIGFVGPGQHAEIKLETFPYTRYGTVRASVKSITADAVSDEKKGAIFPAILRLEKASIDVDGRRIDLKPGMNITAEINTGRRRIIEYVTSPLRASVDGSLKER